MTPHLGILHIEGAHGHGFRLWLPLFLLWVPLVLLSPLILLVILGFCLAAQVNPWKAIATFWAISCSLPGTDVRVETQRNRVRVRLL